MRYVALACDYDGTVAHDGRVDAATIEGLRRLRASGRKLLLVTGRELDELLTVCPQIDLFDWVVAENGALLYQPASRALKALANPPAEGFLRRLVERGVAPISVGKVIVATWEPHHMTVVDVIKELGLELQVIFNKGAVMVLPANVNKATGLAVVLKQMELSPHNAAGVGDAENDHAFLNLCGFSCAVANALPAVKEHADLVTRADHGAGVCELIDSILANGLAPSIRHAVVLGTQPGDNTPILFRGNRLLIAGENPTVSAAALGIIDRLIQRRYQCCIIDAGDSHQALAGIATIGQDRPPTVEEIMEHFAGPMQSVIVKINTLRPDHISSFLQALRGRLEEAETRTGRPHWLATNRCHDALCRDIPALSPVEEFTLLSRDFGQTAPGRKEALDAILAIGDSAQRTIVRILPGIADSGALGLPEEGLLWSAESPHSLSRVRLLSAEST